ncbi:MAG TPA: endolytic transglycosylase MltG [Nevskiaceae bacterium]|nr:endolytic transglycosylase MltG [Nevskiaceae bacterium]
MLNRLLRGLLLLGVLAAVSGWALQREVQRQLQLPLALEAPSTVSLAPGQSLRGLLAALRTRGQISRQQSLAVELQARYDGRASRVQAGEYQLSPGLTGEALIEQLVAGRVIQYSLQIIEGSTAAQMLAQVRAHPQLRQTLPAALDGPELMQAIGSPIGHPEGQFFPDTYHFPGGTTDVAFLARAHQALRRQLDQAWARRQPALPYADAEQALVMASIVEKETGLASERATIAGVFVRRLRLGMLLQTDPTVIYGLGERFDGDLRRRDLLADTPYNTYTRRGLPPTPICLPGAAALQAAVQPADGESLYFVSRGDGSHVFSATLEEHNAAVRRYQLGQGG